MGVPVWDVLLDDAKPVLYPLVVEECTSWFGEEEGCDCVGKYGCRGYDMASVSNFIARDSRLI